MDIKIGSNRGPAGVDKKKKTNRTGAAGGPSFTEMVESASAADDVSEIQQITPVRGVGGNFQGGGNQYVPTDARERGEYMLSRLEELEQDILSGNPTAAAAQLKRALETEAVDRENLSPRLREVLDEIELRASVEVAKLEEDQNK